MTRDLSKRGVPRLSAKNISLTMKCEFLEKYLKTIATLHDDFLPYHRSEVYCLRSHIDLRYIIWISLLELDLPGAIKRSEFDSFFFALILDGSPEIAPWDIYPIIESHDRDRELKIREESDILIVSVKNRSSKCEFAIVASIARYKISDRNSKQEKYKLRISYPSPRWHRVQVCDHFFGIAI